MTDTRKLTQRTAGKSPQLRGFLTMNRLSNEIWNGPPHDLKLLPDEVHVWRADLSKHHFVEPQALALLSEEERDRFRRYLRLEDASRYAVTRILLRMLLGQYLNEPADHLVFRYGKYGKPAFASRCASENLYFNVSHSEDMAIFAFTYAAEVGVDVEYIRFIDDFEAIAGRHFSCAENYRLRQAEPRQQLLNFYRLWTCKEAFTKALGVGLSNGLGYFDIMLTAESPAVLLSVETDTTEASKWCIKETMPAAGYAASIALRSSNSCFRYWSLDL